MTDVTIYKFEKDGQQLPVSQQWLLAAAVGEDGTVYAPAPLPAIALCAAFDGVSIVAHDGHSYYPLPWLRSYVAELLTSAKGQERADLQHLLGITLKRIEASAREAHAQAA